MEQQKRKTIAIKCNGCKIDFEKAFSEYKRNEKNGENHWCSLKCFAKYANNGKGNPKNLKQGREKDNYSPFRYFLRKIKQRNKEKGFSETDITLEFLKELWEKQMGICPITGWDIVLPVDSTGFEAKLDPKKASLDRMIPHKAYMKDNVRFISFMANMCKHEFTDEQVFEFTEAVEKKKLGF